MTDASNSDGIQAPLLARVVAKELVVELAADFADNHVLGRPRRAARLGDRGKELLELERRQVQAIEAVDGIEVDRKRKQLAIHPRPHAMLVRSPLRKPTEVVKDLARVRVEDVRAVGMDENARRVVGVVGVAADVPAFVDHQHLSPRVGCQPFSHHGPSESSSDDQIVEHVLPHCKKTARARKRGCQVDPLNHSGARGGRMLPTTARRRSAMRDHVASHELPERNASARGSQRDAGSQSAALIASTKRSGVSAILASPSSPVGTHDIRDGRRDDGSAGGEIFGRLRRTDEACRLISGERQHGDFPTRDVAGQLLIGLGAEIVDVRARG